MDFSMINEMKNDEGLSKNSSNKDGVQQIN